MIEQDDIKRAAGGMSPLAINWTVIGGLILLFALFMGISSLPDLKRYLVLKSM